MIVRTLGVLSMPRKTCAVRLPTRAGMLSEAETGSQEAAAFVMLVSEAAAVFAMLSEDSSRYTRPPAGKKRGELHGLVEVRTHVSLGTCGAGWGGVHGMAGVGCRRVYGASRYCRAIPHMGCTGVRLEGVRTRRTARSLPPQPSWLPPPQQQQPRQRRAWRQAPPGASSFSPPHQR